MKELLVAIADYMQSGKAGDPNGKFTLNQFLTIVRNAVEEGEAKEGESITIKTRGIVRKVGRGHGTCYLVELPQLDFNEARMIWINPEETIKP